METTSTAPQVYMRRTRRFVCQCYISAQKSKVEKADPKLSSVNIKTAFPSVIYFTAFTSIINLKFSERLPKILKIGSHGEKGMIYYRKIMIKLYKITIYFVFLKTSTTSFWNKNVQIIAYKPNKLSFFKITKNFPKMWRRGKNKIKLSCLWLGREKEEL